MNDDENRPPLVLLHGLTFDRRQWDPVRRELAVIDPARQVLTLDLPGHGDSPRRASYGMAEVAEVVHDQVTEAGLAKPVVVGHSVGAVVATTYAAHYPVRGVVNLDQILLPGPFGAAVRQAESALRGPDWRRVWDGMLAGVGIESLPAEARPRSDQTRHQRLAAGERGPSTRLGPAGGTAKLAASFQRVFACPSGAAGGASGRSSAWNYVRRAGRDSEGRCRNIEKQVHRLWNPEVRPLVREARRCYNSGTTRACIVATWAAVAADLIEKIVRL